MNTHNAIERLRRFLRDHGDNSASMCLLGPDNARAILGHIAALTAERDAAVAEVAQIVAWLRTNAIDVADASNRLMLHMADSWGKEFADAIAAGAHKDSGHVATD